SEDLIQELDWEKIDFDQADFTVGLASALEELDEAGFDLLNYAMPYYWGTIGLIYDNEKEGLEAKLEEQGWAILGDQSVTKMIYDSSRDAFMAALYAQDPIVKMADATQADITAAKNFLIGAKGANKIGRASCRESVDHGRPRDARLHEEVQRQHKCRGTSMTCTCIAT